MRKQILNKLASRFAFFIAFISLLPAFLSAKTILVGPSRTYTVPSAAVSSVASGDTVLIDAGTYTGDVATWSASNITLRGTAKYAHLVAPSTISNGKAIWVISGSNVTIENIEFSNAKVPSLNGAGIRQEGVNVTIRHCYFHDNENGILAGANTTSTILIEYSEFGYNGYGDGYSHNMYIGNVGSFTLQYCNTHHAKIGHLIKSRALVNKILYNRIMDESDGTSSYQINLPNAGTSYIIGNLIQQGPVSGNSVIIDYGSEGLTNSGKDMYVVNNTVVNEKGAGTFVKVWAGAANARITNNIFCGPGTVLDGAGDLTTNLVTTNAGLVNVAGYDYRLTSGSGAVNAGTAPGSANGFSLVPAFQYVHNSNTQARVSSGAIDIGAYEYAGAPLPPGTPNLASPSNTATGQPVSLTLMWNAVSGASTYRVQMSTSSNFTSTIIDDATLTGTTRASGTLANNTTYYWRVNATNVGGTSAWSVPGSFTTVPSLPTPTGDLALNKTATASSSKSGGLAASYAVDGNAQTRWASVYKNNQWISVDLGAVSTISSVRLSWEKSYGKAYKIQTSTDGANWTDIYATSTGDGGVDNLTGLSGSGRYVRMFGITRGTQWGFSLWSFEVYSGNLDKGKSSDADSLAGEAFDLSATPNPFNPSITLILHGVSGPTRLLIYSIAGGQVADLSNQVHERTLTWNAGTLPSGSYVIKLINGQQTLVRKVTLLK